MKRKPSRDIESATSVIGRVMRGWVKAHPRTAQFVASIAVAGIASAGIPATSASAASSLDGFHLSPVKSVPVDGLQMAYRTAGSGPPLVLIMGTNGTMFAWDPDLIAALAVDHKVIIFDNRGVGGSTPADVRNLTVAKQARDTARLMRALHVRSADVLGWSMGGEIAQELALRYPNLVSRLVLSGTDPGGTAPQTTDPSVIAVFSNPTPSLAELLATLFPPNASRAASACPASLGLARPGGRFARRAGGDSYRASRRRRSAVALPRVWNVPAARADPHPRAHHRRGPGRGGPTHQRDSHACAHPQLEDPDLSGLRSCSHVSVPPPVRGRCKPLPRAPLVRRMPKRLDALLFSGAGRCSKLEHP